MEDKLAQFLAYADTHQKDVCNHKFDCRKKNKIRLLLLPVLGTLSLPDLDSLREVGRLPYDWGAREN